ncbi:hypothetical protein CRYUN_Cryun19dG0054600 [Craigia yunnanensis]
MVQFPEKLVDCISTGSVSAQELLPRGTIPPSFGNISSVLYLSLMQNHLEGNIPAEIGKLSNLKFFQLASNKFSGSVPKQLYNISSIILFSVADNQLDGQIPPDLGLTLPNLQLVFRAHSNINSLFLKAIWV